MHQFIAVDQCKVYCAPILHIWQPKSLGLDLLDYSVSKRTERGLHKSQRANVNSLTRAIRKDFIRAFGEGTFETSLWPILAWIEPLF